MTAPKNVKETASWLRHSLNRPALPECPIQAATVGKDPKQPAYISGYRDGEPFVRPINWKTFQKTMPLPEMEQVWFKDSKTGIGTLAGWNGKHCLGWVDFDAKDFVSQEECDRVVTQWIEQYPVLKECPRFRSPGGGYRFLVAWEKDPENFGANNGFTLSPGGSLRCGELLTKNGGHTLLPPTIGINGNSYIWEYFQEYPPVVEAPESVGIYPLVATTSQPEASQKQQATNSGDLRRFLEQEVYPQLSPKQLFHWDGHDWQERRNGKLQGCCPWHDSQSGTAFYVDKKDGVWLWRCPACNIGGDPVSYRYQLKGGRGSPQGKAFIEIIEELAAEAGLCLPEQSKPQRSQIKPELNGKYLEHDEAKNVDVALLEQEGEYQRTFLQQATNDLFPGDWISFGGTLYQYTGSYYQQRSDESLTPSIQRYCNNFSVVKTDREGNETKTYPYAKPKFVKEVLEWQKLGCTVAAEEVNPPGINCTNGVLLLQWEDKTLKPELIPHSSEHYYLSEPKVTYDPTADPVEYERLMQCLDPSSREIWERTIAASLDLPTVRKHQGRAVRALLLKGDGSNGKDTLRTLVQTVLGSGALSSCSVSDFQQYDQGRAFAIYLLRGKLINWPSENADVGRMDELRGLRAAITGDPISFEAKHKMPVQESPKAVFLFNLNETPQLVASLKANASRWGVVPFNKTFSDEPQSGELLADPRFKEDPQFLAEAIAPSFLNQLLRQHQAVVNEGIDFTPTQGLLDDIQRESSHLLQFAADTGLKADPQGGVTVAELWNRLQQWYQDTGTLTIEHGPKGGKKLLWTDQAQRSDRNVKGINQVLPRMLEIFPKAKRGKRRKEGTKNYEPIVMGISFAETAQDAQDGQDTPPQTVAEEETQPFNSVEQQPKNWVRGGQDMPPVVQSDFHHVLENQPGILASEPTVVTSTRPSRSSEILSENGDREHLSHLAQFSEQISHAQDVVKQGVHKQSGCSRYQDSHEIEEAPSPDEWGGLL